MWKKKYRITFYQRILHMHELRWNRAISHDIIHRNYKFITNQKFNDTKISRSKNHMSGRIINFLLSCLLSCRLI